MNLTKQEISKAKCSYHFQKSRAINSRNIEWHLTFDEWINWWLSTGHWHERGKGSNKYVMSRFNDVGPYALNNIYCQTDGNNSREAAVRQKGKKMSEQAKKNMSQGQKGLAHPWQAGTNNRFHSSNLTPELREKIAVGKRKCRKPVQTPFGRFDSQTLAAKALGVNTGTIAYRRKVHPDKYFYLD